MAENNFNFTNGVSYDVWYEQKRLIDQLKKENEELKEKLYQIEDVVKPINEQLPEDSIIRQIMLILNDCNKLEPSRYLKALAPFQDEYFKGLDTTAIAELAKKSIRLTTENRKLETALDEIEEYQKRNCETCSFAETKKCDIHCQVFVILNIIADLRTDETKCNPDSEQIEHTAAKTQMRNSGSVEQIQDSRARGGEAND